MSYALAAWNVKDGTCLSPLYRSAAKERGHLVGGHSVHAVRRNRLMNQSAEYAS